MTSTEFRSVRRGMLPLLGVLSLLAARTELAALAARHQRAELAEQAGRVVRAGRGLGVVLDPERGRVEQGKTLHHTVVQVQVGYLRTAKFCRQRWERRGPRRHGWRL